MVWRLVGAWGLVGSGGHIGGAAPGPADGWRVWAKLAWYAFGNPGLASEGWGDWFAFFLQGFYPWSHDDRALINKADSEYAAAVA
ncbi:hypothetical protein [Sphingomonas sp. S2-65]|uniref:hypothetical protein n=1 Tax=Sphingomonas sp. S2-65 TaxID=2903960 RepID=UPI001F283317|nr:hypothetical protein [Sphingomonas sp. S2-65]UYY59515.1 hypothetical protein LZ586_05355 [Sphingomonas sp. S2-65]